MSGHSKWANIRFRKAAQDAKRGKIFTKLIREITTAARMGGGDESSNPRLRSAVVAALAQNMTRDTIKRAIERGVGGGDGVDLENITYEGYGVGGAAVMVECMTDNHNRTASEVRHAFSKFGGNLGTSGSVNYLFTKKGVISFAPDEDGKMNIDEEKAMEIGLEAGADDIVTNDDGIYWRPNGTTMTDANGSVITWATDENGNTIEPSVETEAPSEGETSEQPSEETVETPTEETVEDNAK